MGGLGEGESPKLTFCESDYIIIAVKLFLVVAIMHDA
mgnify:CR=1 FL=1